MKQKVSPSQKVLNVWAVILIIWSIYRVKFKLPEWFDEFIAKPVVFILPVYYYLKKVEKKKFFQALDWKLKPRISDIMIGLLTGALFFLTTLLSNFIKTHRIFAVTQGLNMNKFVLVILIAFATSISEEVLSRGFVLKRLYEESKNVYMSSFFASILFFFLHVPILFTNVKLTGNLLLYFMFTDMLLSLTNSFIYLERRSLAVPILIHAFYNLSIFLLI